jgi:hypothetical protein
VRPRNCLHIQTSDGVARFQFFNFCQCLQIETLSEQSWSKNDQ